MVFLSISARVVGVSGKVTEVVGFARIQTEKGCFTSALKVMSSSSQIPLPTNCIHSFVVQFFKTDL